MIGRPSLPRSAALCPSFAPGRPQHGCFNGVSGAFEGDPV